MDDYTDERPDTSDELEMKICDFLAGMLNKLNPLPFKLETHEEFKKSLGLD